MEHIFEKGGDTLLLLGRVYFKALSAEVWLKHPDRKNGELHIFDLIFSGLSHGEQNQIVDSMRGRIQNIFLRVNTLESNTYKKELDDESKNF